MIVRWLSILLFCCLLQINGCARKAPSPGLLQPGNEAAARLALDNFLARTCCSTLDADLSLAYQRLTGDISMSAMLQADVDGRLRFSIIDPVGRSLFLFVVKDGAFIVTDNRRARGYSGQVGSPSWRKYVPSVLPAGDIFSWLSGGVQSRGMYLAEIGEEKEGGGYWYVLEYGDTRRHHILLDPATLTLREHLVLNDRGDVVLVATYERYQDNGSECPWPMDVQISGADVSGKLELTTDRLYPCQVLPEKTFHLQPPPHFSIEQLP